EQGHILAEYCSQRWKRNAACAAQAALGSIEMGVTDERHAIVIEWRNDDPAGFAGLDRHAFVVRELDLIAFGVNMVSSAVCAGRGDQAAFIAGVNVYDLAME